MTKHDEIAKHLTEDILAGRYRTGERLPSERDLSIRFDTNRGAVREAMKKLSHLGLARIQPGGARVCPMEEASLDIIGHMMSQGDLPSVRLVDQVLSVINSLILMAADAALTNASDTEIEDIRRLSRVLYGEDLDEETRMLAHVDLIRAIMMASDNLVCRLIAKSLLEQFIPNMSAIEGHTQLDVEAYKTYTRQLDRALLERDRDSVQAIFKGISELNRKSILKAMESARHSLALESIERSHQINEAVSS